MTVERLRPAVVLVGGLVALSLVAGPLDVGRSTGSVASYDAVVVFRNDDVQAGYEHETMRAVDRVFIDEGVPVSLGVIADGLERDGRTCSYLRSLTDNRGDQFEIAAHGETHEAETEFGGASEFGGHDRDEQARKVERVTERLAACTGERPTTFIPPFDTYDATTVDVLDDYGYKTVSGGPHARTQFSDTARDSAVPGAFRAGNLTHVPQSQAFVADWDTHELRDVATLESAFKDAAENGSIYVQMLHYHAFSDPADRERLRAFLRSIDEYGDVRFATLGELGALVRADEIRYDDADEQWYVGETSERGPDIDIESREDVRFGRSEQAAEPTSQTEVVS